jgi:enamine deaminase RidA (YjgF/YER057c/UK114 family)
MSRVTARLAELGVTLPPLPAAAANYIPFTKTGSLVHVAGQIPKSGNDLLKGKLGAELSIEEGQAAAKLCIINFLATVQVAAGGNLDRVKQIAKINVFINSAGDFVDQPKVANGASDFLIEVFGEQGRHARSAVGVYQLPFGVAVEIDGVVELYEDSKL